MRRLAAAASLLLLGLVAVGAAEASLLALLVLFGLVLKLRLTVELGPVLLQFVNQPWFGESAVTVFNAAAVGSLVFTTGCGLGAAVWRSRRWRPAA